MKTGPIILVEDDEDDHYFFEKALQECNIRNLLRWFGACDEAYKYLQTTSDKPFLIFCDVNLPRMSGLAFKKQIDQHPELRKKSIPFVFFSTSVDQHFVNKAYMEMDVQGFFQKPTDFSELKVIITLITDYWKSCKHPNL